MKIKMDTCLKKNLATKQGKILKLWRDLSGSSCERDHKFKQQFQGLILT